MVLTTAQRNDLHKAIVEYLEKDQVFKQSAATFRTEAELEDVDCSSAFATGILERKWTSVVRLQKKVMDLEKQVSQLQDNARAAEKHARGVQVTHKDFLPRSPPLHVLKGHRKAITSIALHPVYHVLVSASEDATIKVWDLETGEFERTLKGHTNSVTCIRFDASGSRLASGSTDMTIRLWNFDMTTKSSAYSCRRTFTGHDHTVSDIVFTPSGDDLISGSRDNTIKIWNSDSGFCIHTIYPAGDWVRSLSINSGGTLLACGTQDHSIQVWNLTSYEAVLELPTEHTNAIESVCLSNNQQTNSLRTALRSQYAKQQAISQVTQDTNHTDKFQNGDIPSYLSNNNETENCFLMTCSRDCTIRVFDVATGICIATLLGHESWVRSAIFHPCGTLALSIGEDRTFRVWDIAQQECIRKIEDAHPHFVSALDVHPQRPIFVTGGVDASLVIWSGQ